MNKGFKSYPRGKLTPDDDGAVSVAIGVKNDVVILSFPYPVAWVGLPAELAEQLADTIKERAKEARRNRH